VPAAELVSADRAHAEQPYAEWPGRIPGAVLWSRVTGPPGGQRVLPDGCMDLIWRDGELIVAGPDTQAHLPSDPPGRHYAGVRFGPGGAPGVLGVPAAELRDRRVPLDAIWPSRQVRRLLDRLHDSSDPVGGLEAAVLAHLDRAHRPGVGIGPDGGPEPWVRAAVEAVRRGASVPDLAEATGWSERQLRRRCLEVFGYGPKMLGRVLRMNDALELARAGTPFAEVAAVTGYADQAHLTRDWRDLTGTTPRELVGPPRPSE
jgi:AraC-like DNA-binding protein